MPLYQFRCAKCELEFEGIVSYELAMAAANGASVLDIRGKPGKPKVDKAHLAPVLQHKDLVHATKCKGRAIYVPMINVVGEKKVLGAVMSDGRRVPGHFNKEAKRNRTKR